MLRNIQDNRQKRILCYLSGEHHFALYYNIFLQNDDLVFYVYSKNISFDSYRKSNLYDLDNVFFVENEREMMYKLNQFSLYITTESQMAWPHRNSLSLIKLCKAASIPVIELQHGLFQLGLHYYSIPRKFFYYADALPVKSVADYVLTYYAVPDCPNSVCIGYPPYHTCKNSIDGEYVLVLSNLHWGSAYTREDVYRFYNTVFKYAANHPEQLIIWKMHYGEWNIPYLKGFINNLKLIYPSAVDNIIFYYESEMLKMTSLVDLIRKSNYVISTVSTVLLDCEIYGKEVYTYRCPGVECLINRLQSANSFRNYEELSALMSEERREFHTGLLRPYDNSVFRSFITKVVEESNPCSSSELIAILENNKYEGGV